MPDPKWEALAKEFQKKWFPDASSAQKDAITLALLKTKVEAQLAGAQKEIERLKQIAKDAIGKEILLREKAEAAVEQLIEASKQLGVELAQAQGEIHFLGGQIAKAREEGRREQREKDLKIAGMGWQNPGDIYKAIQESKP